MCEHDWIPYKFGAGSYGGGLGANTPTSFELRKVICKKCGEIGGVDEI